MNQTVLLRIIERLERLLAKLPEKIRRPVLRELTPLKELFLKQRPPRFLFVGSSGTPMQQIINLLFPQEPGTPVNVSLVPVHRWTDWSITGHGTISILDGREAAESAEIQIEEDLKRQSADVIFFFDDAQSDLQRLVATNTATRVGQEISRPTESGTIIGLCVGSVQRAAQLEQALQAQPASHAHFVSVIRLTDNGSADTRRLMSVLVGQLPNEAKIEMIRISRDREAQHHVAQMLIKSTTAICTAIGAQPIPLADMPVLTSLQVMMVSGIMYISGRERSLRAATEFITALGANVGAGMLLREGARAMLKFLPGWGNILCGMIAGAGTYAIGRAASAFFIGGVSLKDARQKYLATRKKASRKVHRLEDSRRASKSIE